MRGRIIYEPQQKEEDMKEKTITICGQEVTLRYCAATEKGFEDLQGKSISKIDFENTGDLIALGICAIVASYSYRDQEPPIEGKTILYEADPDELIALVNATMEARAEFYHLPAVVEPDKPAEGESDDKPKN